MIPAPLATRHNARYRLKMNADTLTRADALDSSIARAAQALRRHQQPDGHWRFPLEADATIPSEYVLLRHYLARPDPALEAGIAAYLRRIQNADGGWPLFWGGAADLSATVKAYFALKMIGDDPEAPHMRRARARVLALGGAERSNVFTRIQLALYGEVPWRAVPSMPIEIMLLPRWFFFHLSKVSYWSRTVIVPLLVLMALQPRARNPRGVHVPELFCAPPEAITDWLRGPYRSSWGHLFRWLDRALKRAEPRFPQRRRARAMAAAEAWVRERLNGEDGLGAIYPAMANTVMMFDALGCADTDPDVIRAWRAVERLVVREPDGSAWVQPCVSPVWDTGLAGHAMAEARESGAVGAAAAWLAERQVNDVAGDWSVRRPTTPAGGWAFQYANPHYPDVDDTALVAMLLDRSHDPAHEAGIGRARDWILGMQSSDGGWGAFEPENTHDYLNHIPFADHGALLDPPTADVTARCLGFLSQIGLAGHPAAQRAAAFLRRHQEPDGSWFGRWGTNYIYGTWSALVGLAAAGVAPDDPAIARAASWLLSVQREDGGWGEAEDTYAGAPPGRFTESTPSQTAWALLGLMAAGRVDDPAVERGIMWLSRHQDTDGEWREAPYTAVGFPRVFYLRYHGYRLYFPLLALARYRNLTRGNDRQIVWGF